MGAIMTVQSVIAYFLALGAVGTATAMIASLGLMAIPVF
jgi:hypothetical protein